MTDRELLELAAKAGGIQIGCRGCGKFGCIGECEWTPLINDGDALRLAVKLKIIIDFDLEGANTNSELYDIEWCCELYGDDPCAATRRAITRAAAEIGKAMK